MIRVEEIRSILASDNRESFEKLAEEAATLTRRHFGRAKSLFAPLYLANYCDNGCLYCGFSQDRPIDRMCLEPAEIDAEMESLSGTGIRHVLLLTGESRSMTPVGYIRDAVERAHRRFATVSLEIYPLEEPEYGEMIEAGADGVTLYQETYNRTRYAELHPYGRKADYEYRRQAPERMARAGMHRITLGVLLGLAPIAEDAAELFLHLESLQRQYPGIDLSASFPRLIPLPDNPIQGEPVSDIQLIKLICLARILFPTIGITLSTRERPLIRDKALHLGVTRISAASRTTVGGYASRDCHDGQFSVQDERSLTEVITMLKANGMDPVLTDWHSLPADGQ